MDFDSSSKFISSLAKFLQSLCNGYVEFNNGVEVIGHIYINVDTGKKIDYVLNEKVCKTDENSVTFISNSFHAQPAEKPKQPEKTPKVNTPESDNAASLQDEIIIMDEPENENIGTVQVNQEHHKPRPPKRSHNQEFLSGRASKYSKANQSIKHNVLNSEVSSDSLHSENNSSNAAHFSGNNSMTLASGSNIDHESKVYPVSFSDNSKFHEEERDVKPQLDDLTSVNVKQEYGFSNQDEENSERYDDSQGIDYTDIQYEYYGDGSEGGPDHSHMSSGSHGDYYQEGAGISGDGGASNSAGYADVKKSEFAYRYLEYDSIHAYWKAGHGCPVAECPSKAAGFRHHRQINRHWRETHELYVPMYRCTLCPYISKRRSNVVRHTHKKHGSLGDEAVGPEEIGLNKEYVDPGPYTLEQLFGCTQAASYKGDQRLRISAVEKLEV